MTFKEYIVIFILWIFFFIVYCIFFWNDVSIHALLTISFVAMSVIKSIYDVVNRTGYQKMYVYSEETNQNLRYFATFIVISIAVFYHYILFCYMLHYCAQTSSQ